MTQQEIKTNLLTIESNIKAIHTMIWDLAGQQQTDETDRYMAALWRDLAQNLAARDRYLSIGKQM